MDAVKKSKVKSVQANGTWDGQYGLFYKWEVTMENGDSGQYMGKQQEQNKFIVGQETAYTYDTTKPDFHKIKPFSDFKPSGQNNQFTTKVNSKGGADVQEMIVRQSSLKAAVEFYTEDDLKELLSIADKMVAWVYNKECCEAKANGEMKEVGSTDMPF